MAWNQMELRAMQENPAVLTVPEVAAYLRVTTKTVYNLIKNGELKHFRIGRALRCRRQDVETFVAMRAASTGFQLETQGMQEGE